MDVRISVWPVECEPIAREERLACVRIDTLLCEGDSSECFSRVRSISIALREGDLRVCSSLGSRRSVRCTVVGTSQCWYASARRNENAGQLRDLSALPISFVIEPWERKRENQSSSLWCDLNHGRCVHGQSPNMTVVCVYSHSSFD